MSLRETLQAIYASPDQITAESQLHWWCGWALRSRLEPFRTLAKTVRQHWQGILAYFPTGLTSAAIEAVNGVIQLAKRTARASRIASTSARRLICELADSNSSFRLSTNSKLPTQNSREAFFPVDLPLQFPVPHLHIQVEKAPNARQEIMVLGRHFLNCRVVEHRKKILFPCNRITNQFDQLRPGCQDRL
jgi:hypothetical protein